MCVLLKCHMNSTFSLSQTQTSQAGTFSGMSLIRIVRTPSAGREEQRVHHSTLSSTLLLVFAVGDHYRPGFTDAKSILQGFPCVTFVKCGNFDFQRYLIFVCIHDNILSWLAPECQLYLGLLTGFEPAIPATLRVFYVFSHSTTAIMAPPAGFEPTILSS